MRVMSDEELDQMATCLREKLDARFGKRRVTAFFTFDPEVSMDFIQEVYLAFRNKMQ